jgi:hypothetical protein
MKEKKNHSIFFFFFPSALYRIKLIKALSRPLTCLYSLIYWLQLVILIRVEHNTFFLPYWEGQVTAVTCAKSRSNFKSHGPVTVSIKT